jgi:hypothetical protein
VYEYIYVRICRVRNLITEMNTQFLKWCVSAEHISNVDLFASVFRPTVNFRVNFEDFCCAIHTTHVHGGEYKLDRPYQVNPFAQQYGK